MKIEIDDEHAMILLGMIEKLRQNKQIFMTRFMNPKSKDWKKYGDQVKALIDLEVKMKGTR